MVEIPHFLKTDSAFVAMAYWQQCEDERICFRIIHNGKQPILLNND
jgi:hypothetical protein